MKESNYKFIQKLACFNATHLKIFAIITMTIDHVGAVLYPQYHVLRIIGRFAFPIFAFLIVEGMIHTHDAKKYLIRLGTFALISEIPFDLAFYNRYWYSGAQNIFFTLFLGALCIYILQNTYRQSVSYTFVICVSLIAEILNTDYGMIGVWLIVSLFYTRGKLWQVLITLFMINVCFYGGIQMYATLAVIPIALYNGEKGTGGKAFFYSYYPVHLLVIKWLLEYWW